MIITKGDRVYSVKESAKKWAVTREDNKLSVTFDVAKELCPTEERLREYVTSSDLF